MEFHPHNPFALRKKKQKTLPQLYEELRDHELQKERKKRGSAWNSFDDVYEREKKEKSDEMLERLKFIDKLRAEGNADGEASKASDHRIRENLASIYASQKKAQESLPKAKRIYNEVLADLRKGDFLNAGVHTQEKPKPVFYDLNQNNSISRAERVNATKENAVKQATREIREHLDASDASLADLSATDARPAKEILELLDRRKKEKESEDAQSATRSEFVKQAIGVQDEKS